MKKLIFTAVLSLVCSQLNAKKTFDWTMPEGELINVLKCARDTKKTELIRIYSSGQYEHLLYETKTGNKEFVQRIVGKYAYKRKKITFFQPKNKVFSGKFKYGTYFINQHLYTTRKEMVLNRVNPLYESDFIYYYSKPFFMSLYSDAIVHNKEAQAELNLDALVAFFMQDAVSQEEIIDNIEWFIVQAIDYDIEGYESDNLVNDQYDINAILAGPNRLAVCAGYANLLSTFAQMAGIEAQNIDGYSRSNFSDISKLSGYHVWTKLTIDGEEQLHDVTWADIGNHLDYTWINVRPEIMIGSHFPDHLEDQLLDTPVLQTAYLNSASLVAFGQDAEIAHSYIPATYFVNQELNLTFEKDARVSFYRIEEDVLMMNKSFDKMRVEKELYMYPVSNYTCNKSGDSAIYHFDISSFITVFNVEVNDEYSLMFVVVNGNEKDLLRHYAEKGNDVHYEHYLKSILAAIKLKDYEQLKKITDNDTTLFFDQKGTLKLNPSIRQSIESWDGTLSDLHEMTNKTIEEASDGSEKEEIWNSYYTEIPNGLRFTLKMVDGHYSVSAIE
jgi:hypothetical protein